MNAKTEKIKKISKVLWAFSSIGGILLIAATVTFIFFIIREPDMAAVTLYGAVLPIDASSEEFPMIMASSMIYTAFMANILFITGLIFRDISRECTPFSLKHVKRLKRISLIIIMLNILIPVIRVIYYTFYLTDALQKVYVVDLNISGLVFAAILYCLALIFEYGIELQQFSDEAL